MDADVIVIGAGIAGVAAANELAGRGWRVRVLEARDRTGGRILSSDLGVGSPPVELGAEFIHGGSRRLRAVVKQAGLASHAAEVPMWWQERGQLQQVPDFWRGIRRVVGEVPRRNHGWSFQRFMREKGRRLDAGERERAKHYVAGFNAAPLDRLSAHAMRIDHAGADTEDLKLDGRYDAVVHELQKTWPAGLVELRLRSVVQAVHWRRGEVTVKTRSRRGRTETHRATAAVVTLPLGVLKARAVRFAPPLAEKQRIIARMGWGHVVRVLFRFRDGFWHAPFVPPALAVDEGRAFGFVNAPNEDVPVWWALMPPAPVLTGWAGGPAADKLKHLSPARVRDAAIRSLAGIFHASQTDVRRELASWRMHDWTGDPFTRGAYSYAAAGAEDAPEQLAAPVEDTLFFAGEATAPEAGTVHGALASGVRAGAEAGRMLNTLRRSAVARTILGWF